MTERLSTKNTPQRMGMSSSLRMMMALTTVHKVGIQLTVDHTKLHPHRWWHYVGRR